MMVGNSPPNRPRPSKAMTVLMAFTGLIILGTLVLTLFGWK